MSELRARFATCYGHATTSRNKRHIVQRIVWASQRDAYGDISDAARDKAMAIADDRDVRERFPKKPSLVSQSEPNASHVVAYQPKVELLPGTVLHRNYQGTDIRLLVLEKGFEWDGRRFKSLSAAARAITGTRWNGKLFFGLKNGASK